MNSSQRKRGDRARAYLRDVSQTCKEYGVAMYFGRGRQVLYRDLLCMGYFDDMHHAPPRYAVATGRPLSEWLPIAVHEFCHVKQWIERVPAWTNQVITPSACALDLLGEWFNGREMKKEQIAKLVRVAREVERDCEERTVSEIIRHRLPIDPAKYAKQANSYVFSYTAMSKTRAWYARSPRDIPQILKLMPDEILPERAYEDLPAGYLDALRKYCY